MKNNLVLIAILLGLMILLPSCVREVDFSAAHQKKVVLHCIIHTYGGYDRPSYPGFAPDYSVYAMSSSTQRLYMYYNAPNGEKEYLPEAKARLWDDETNELLAEFTRVSEEEWKADYLPPYKIIDEEVNEYSIHLRLEVEIPGEETLVARSCLERRINTKAWEYHHAVQGGYYYLQRDEFPGPVWLLPEAVEAIRTRNGLVTSNYEYVKHIPISSLQTNYIYADPFNFADERFLYGIRVLPDNRVGDGHITMTMGTPQQERIDNFHSRVYLTYTNLTYVSEEYDKYLKDAIVYRIRHDNVNDPLKHLYEDQVFTNIEGGIGVFGVEVMVHPLDLVHDD